MEIDKEQIQTQEETGELAPMDQVEERVEAEMKNERGHEGTRCGSRLLLRRR